MQSKRLGHHYRIYWLRVRLRQWCITNNNKYIISIENVSLNMDKINKNQLVKRVSRGKNHKNIIGTGLGLAIVTEAVQALKGKFNIKIENKKKLITSILLPLK